MERDNFPPSYVYSDCLKPVVVSPPQYSQEDKVRVDDHQIFCHILVKYNFHYAAGAPVTQAGKTKPN